MFFNRGRANMSYLNERPTLKAIRYINKKRCKLRKIAELGSNPERKPACSLEDYTDVRGKLSQQLGTYHNVMKNT